MTLEELNAKICECFGIEAGNCVKLILEFSALEPPKVTAEMFPKVANEEILTTLDGYKHLVNFKQYSDGASGD
jgi:hypothetical protein